jgi:hypothetical protein
MPSYDCNPTNEVFQKALQRHIDRWQSDPRTFSSDSTPDDVRAEIETYEKKHEKTIARRYVDRLAGLLQRFESIFRVIDMFVSSNPQIAALVWGGLKFVIQACSHHNRSSLGTSSSG